MFGTWINGREKSQFISKIRYVANEVWVDTESFTEKMLRAKNLEKIKFEFSMFE